MSLRPLTIDDLPIARALLVASLPHERIDVVCEEKLFGDDGARTGSVHGAFEGELLVGVVAQAGRFVKLLAVHPSVRRQGIGSALLERAAAMAPGLVLRMGDHPGNYLSPGVDARYADGLAFLGRHGFVERGRVENLRVPYAGNALVTQARATSLVEAAASLGYRVARPSPMEIEAVLALITREFAPVWAKECRLAHVGPRRAFFAAFGADEMPVAFAAADGNNQGLGWFGPAGTLPPHRGKKLGEALLLSCLLAVQDLPEAGVIAWIGPRPFYERAAAAVSDRTFVQLERPL